MIDDVDNHGILASRVLPAISSISNQTEYPAAFSAAASLRTIG